ncbi:MAG: hypothetical protein ACFCUO_05500 [Rhodospirillales bacterium]
MYFSYDHLKFRYEPFPIGYARPILDDACYREMVGAYPPVELFKYIPKIGKKYSLSERYHGRRYREFVASSPVWREFRGWLKSDDFIYGVLDALRQRHLDLGFKRPQSAARRLWKRTKDLARGRFGRATAGLSSRFEFSMLPADGGSVTPHTDAPGKIVTLIISMIAEGEWDPAFGGGTDLNRPKSETLIFNPMNRQAAFEEMEVLDTFPFTPNQAVVFVKTFNSWHSVRPMQGAGANAMRKTLTINIEAR